MFFWENGDGVLVLLSFSHCKLKYLGLAYFTVYINFVMFSLKQEKPDDTLLHLYIFLKAMHLNLKEKKSVWNEQLTFPLNCFALV